MARNGNGMQASLARMAEREPELAGRLLVSSLPAAAASIEGPLDYDLVLEGVGAYAVSIRDGKATVAELDGAPNADAEFTLLTDAGALARLAAGASPLGLMLRGRLRIRGNRLKALALRKLAGDLTMRDIARAGVTPEPGLVYRALPYAIDPQWTRGHRFSVVYRMQPDDTGDGGTWCVQVDDGTVTVAGEPPAGGADSTVELSHETWLRLVRGEANPTDAMRRGLVKVEGKLHPVTLLGRWIDRAEGRDDRELEREHRQRAVQETRVTWGSCVNGLTPQGQGDPAEAPAAKGRKGAGPRLLGYEELYALWERQNWRAHEIDFSVDKEQWLATPTDGQRETRWTMSSFYIGEERVAADLAPFVLAAPSGEVEIFLTTQLVDEARHAAFFDRFMAEVMALEPGDIRGRLQQMEEGMLAPWREVFDEHLRGISQRILAKPDDLDLFVEGIVTYHVIIEGVLAMTGQHSILKYVEAHDLYPGFKRGFSLVEQDEHRHIAFGVRFLSDVCREEPRYRSLIERKIAELVPVAAHVFVPPGTADPSDFVSYDFHSSEIYGFAYRALKRRMAVVGVEVPPPDQLMPGPIDQPARAA